MSAITARPAPGAPIEGEHVALRDSAEPTVQEAADLIRATVGLGTVARLDYVHAALCLAYARGRAVALAEAHDLVTLQ